MVKVVHEQWKCIGCGACAGVCAKYWEMGDDNKAHLKGASYKDTDAGKLGELTLDAAECNKDAEGACPVQCIHVKEGEAPAEKPAEAPKEEAQEK